MKNIHKYDNELYEILKKEIYREESTLELIASENFTSKSVMEMAGSVMTNKYAEGYPGKRYYGGCEFVDEAENLARERLKKLFGVNILMCNLILDHKRIWLFFLLFLIQVTQLWA